MVRYNPLSPIVRRGAMQSPYARWISRAAAILVAFLLLAPLLARAQLSIEITGAGANRIPIAIVPFPGEAALPPGIRYFQEQRIRAGGEKELSLWLNETCRQVASDLMKQASDFCECPVMPRETPESGIEVVLNWAFLLSRSATTAFRAQVDQLNANRGTKGLVFELSGPWPPYRFVPALSMGAAP